jgi:hypothetical protein
MTSTDCFQKEPNYYTSRDICENKTKLYNVWNCNERYPRFDHVVFHAGDEEQFNRYKYTHDKNTHTLSIKDIKTDNIFTSLNLDVSDKFKDVNIQEIQNTFKYLFYKFKKGIYVKIRNNDLKVFLPFSNDSFENEWYHKIKINSETDDLSENIHKFKDLMKHLNFKEGRKFNPRWINDNIHEWYSNNGLFRFEYPMVERDTNVPTIKDMIIEMCKNRKIPDIDFFINRRDFPLLKNDETEPYDNIWGENTPLQSHKYDKYIPILSMSKKSNYADILSPTYDDWAKIRSEENKWFIKTCKDFDKPFDTPWETKKPIAVFRGSNSGIGVDHITNPRINLIYTYHNIIDEEDKKLLDVGITKWNLRPRKSSDNIFLSHVNTNYMKDYGTKPYLSYKEYSEYKYIIHIDGYVSAFRLSTELSMGSVILMVESEWKLWFSEYLKPWTHYVPVNKNLSDIVEKIKWCRENDDKCKEISNNAKIFHTKFLNKNSILDYLQKTMFELKNKMGDYLHRENKPDFIFPEFTKCNTTNTITIKYIDEFILHRTYNHLKTFEKIFENTDNTTFENVENVNDIYEIVQNNSQSNSVYIGKYIINDILQYIPNFIYTHGSYKIKNTIKTVFEKLDDFTLTDYIDSKYFNIDEFFIILLQISISLQYVQNKHGFVHNHLTTDNIVIHKLSEPIETKYYITSELIYNIKSDKIPIIKNFFKTNIYKNKKYFHSPFEEKYIFRKFKDIFTIIISSFNKILKKNIQRHDITKMIYFFQLFRKIETCNTTSNYRDITSLIDIKYFLKYHKLNRYLFNYDDCKYNKQFEQYDPLYIFNFIQHLCKNFKIITNITNINILSPCQTKNIHVLSKKQIYDFITGKNPEHKINGILKEYVRIKKVLDTIDNNNLGNTLFSIHHIQEISIILKNTNLFLQRYLSKQHITFKPSFLHIYKNLSEHLKNSFRNQETNINTLYEHFLKDKLNIRKIFKDNNNNLFENIIITQNSIYVLNINIKYFLKNILL